MFTFEKYHDLDSRVRGHLRSLDCFDRSYMTSCLCSVVTMAPSCTVFDIFDFENAATLQSGSDVTQDHMIACPWFAVSLL